MITPMSRVEIICLRSILQEMVVFVQEQGLLHLEDVPLVMEDEAVSGYLNPVRHTHKQQQERDQLTQLDRNLAEMAPLLTASFKPAEIEQAVAAWKGTAAEDWERQVREWNRSLRPLARAKVNHADNIAIIQQYLEMVTALAPQVDKSRFRLGQGARFVVMPGGSASKAAQLAEMLAEKLGAEVRFLHQKINRRMTAGLVLYPEGLEAGVGTVLHEAGVTPLDAPEAPIKGLSLDEAAKKLREQLADQQRLLEEAKISLIAYSQEQGAKLLALKSMISDLLQRFLATDNMAGTQMIAVIRGWMPRESTDAFKKALEARYGERASMTLLPMEEVPAEQVPTKLKNSKFFRPFELLLELFPPPTYGGMDPSMWVGLSFIFFYGFILADFVYGAFIVSIAWWVYRKYGHNAIGKSIATLSLYMGVSSMVFGVVFGEYMGNLGEHFLGLQPLWTHRMSAVMPLMYISFVIGIIHVGSSFLFGIREAMRHGHMNHAYEKAGMLSAMAAMIIAILAILGYAIGSPTVSYGIAGGLMVASVALLFLGMGKAAVIQMLEYFSLATNVMSYSRLMALGLASTALADVGNGFVEHGGNIFVGVVIDILFQSINFGLGLFSPTLHSLRLNYVESLPKFYDPKGYKYQPFRKELPW